MRASGGTGCQLGLARAHTRSRSFCASASLLSVPPQGQVRCSPGQLDCPLLLSALSPLLQPGASALGADLWPAPSLVLCTGVPAGQGCGWGTLGTGGVIHAHPSMLVVSAVWEPCLPSPLCSCSAWQRRQQWVPGGKSPSPRSPEERSWSHPARAEGLPGVEVFAEGGTGPCSRLLLWDSHVCRTSSAHTGPSHSPSSAQTLQHRAKLQPHQQAVSGEGGIGNRQGQASSYLGRTLNLGQATQEGLLCLCLPRAVLLLACSRGWGSWQAPGGAEVLLALLPRCVAGGGGLGMEAASEPEDNSSLFPTPPRQNLAEQQRAGVAWFGAQWQQQGL